MKKYKKKCAILTIKDLSDFACYDDLLVPPMDTLGWDISFIPWDLSDVNWNDYDIILIRSTWDYQSRIQEFLKVLDSIDKSKSLLINPLPIIHWNIEKTYLIELEAKGIGTIPSLFQKKFSPKEIIQSFLKFNCDKIIIKPVVGANADNIILGSKFDIKSQLHEIQGIYSELPHIIQPFLNSVLKEGEFSLIYFNEKFSHALSKIPKEGDFRVQEEHGGKINIIKRLPIKIQNLADKVIKVLPKNCFYSRIDILLMHGEPKVIEVELIEPSLYFNLDPESSKMFAHELIEYFNNLT